MELSEAAKYSKAIKNNFGVILQNILLGLMATSPIFKIPIVGYVVKSYLNKLLGKALEDVRLQVFFKFIDMRVADQKGEYTNAVLNWENAKLTGDDNEIQRTQKIMLDKFDNFVKFNRV